MFGIGKSSKHAPVEEADVLASVAKSLWRIANSLEEQNRVLISLTKTIHEASHRTSWTFEHCP